jgi:pimeloyl-ACP methyl ester carboxylesterase
VVERIGPEPIGPAPSGGERIPPERIGADAREPTRVRRRGRRLLLPIDRLLKGAAESVLLKPWLDEAALRLITRWYFPLSRAWAEAVAANGNAEAFLARLPLGGVGERLLPHALAPFRERSRVLAAADARWEEAFFGRGPADPGVEEARMATAQAWMALRSAFMPIHCLDAFPAVAWDIEPPASVMRRQAPRLAEGAAFPPDIRLDQIEASRGFRGAHGMHGWLRFPSPAAAIGDVVYARLAAPIGKGPRGGGDAMPTLIFCHGIGMEPEYWRDRRVAFADFVEAGVRVIRPEAPWHGRRRAAGCYGGEPLFARGPGGLIDFLHAVVLELGTLIAWARATRGGPVALAGVSLGALSAQLVASAAHHWPRAMRPDALLLIAPSLSLSKVTFEGSLTRALGVPDAVVAAGWTGSEIERWRPLMEPADTPALDPDRIVVVLGETDDVTLAAGGENLVDIWRVPEINVFRYPAGHFTTSAALLRGGPAIHRLRTLIGRLVS